MDKIQRKNVNLRNTLLALYNLPQEARIRTVFQAMGIDIDREENSRCMVAWAVRGVVPDAVAAALRRDFPALAEDVLAGTLVMDGAPAQRPSEKAAAAASLDSVPAGISISGLSHCCNRTTAVLPRAQSNRAIPASNGLADLERRARFQGLCELARMQSDSASRRGGRCRAVQKTASRLHRANIRPEKADPVSRSDSDSVSYSKFLKLLKKQAKLNRKIAAVLKEMNHG